MLNPRFSVSTLAALTDVVTGGPGNIAESAPIGIYRSGPELERFLGGAGIDLDIGRTGSRLPSVRDALRSHNETDTGRQAIRKLVEQVADPREYLRFPERHEAVVNHLNQHLRPDGLELRRIGSRNMLVAASTGSVAGVLRDAAKALDFESVKLDFDRALAQTESDPEDAVTSACSIIESAFKCLLDELKAKYPDKQGIAGLAKTIEEHLNLSPARPDLEPDIKQILGGLSNVARGIGSLRTHSGDAHGHGKRVRRLDSRIARLAIHAASTISLFYIETWQKQQKVEGSSS